MKHRMTKYRRAFTLIELIITMALSTIIILGMGVILVDNQKGWSMMYDRTYSDVVTDAYIARDVFVKVARKSSIKTSAIGNDREYIQLYYYQNPAVSIPDRYAKFYVSSGNLLVDHGDLEPGTWNTLSVLSTMTLARNVDSVKFDVTGTSVQMVLSLNNNKEAMTIACSAVRHNDG
jgi:prepilin-type N-terminal cleavage/methylation domain-containing protein